MPVIYIEDARCLKVNRSEKASHVNEIKRFQVICGTIRKHLKKTRTDTRMKFCKFVARSTLLYGSETWATTK